MEFEFSKDPNGATFLKVAVEDYALLFNPLLNKGMAFTQEERDEFNLRGIIPPLETSLQTQVLRSYAFYQSKTTPLEKYIYLRDLQDSNETLFYRLLLDHIEEMIPIVYTPTVGLGCQRYSHIYRRPRGVIISYPDRKSISKILANPRFKQTKIIVVSDGERILGLGDQGAGGMGIPIGKLSLYSACAGIHPAYTLPILLDTGTNNKTLLNDPMYIGWRHERIKDPEYSDFIATFVEVVKKQFPHVVLQWEDFAQHHANPILETFKDQLCTFNDDIQGTAAVAAGTLLAAIHVTGIPLAEQRIVVAGAGSAGCGISTLIKKTMMEKGLSQEEARAHFYLVDREGLLLENTQDLLSFQKPFATPLTQVANWELENPNQISFKDVIRNVRPTLLIGVSGQTGIFTEEIVRYIAKHVERPIIFPLSNPTEKAEAHPQDLLNWTEGAAIISTGSPFENIIKNGELVRIDQTNNSYIFPGLGLGLIAVKSKRVNDKMLLSAAQTLAQCSPAKNNKNANLLPPLTQIRDVSFKIAHAVANEALEGGLVDFEPPNLQKAILDEMWDPQYLPYKKWKKNL